MAATKETTVTDIQPADAPRTAIVITVSTRAAGGIYTDRSGPVIEERLREWGFTTDAVIVADGPAYADAIAEVLAGGPDLVVTTGGTGIGPKDLTPEMTRPHLDKELPGLEAQMVARGVANGVPASVLSRSACGVAGTTLVVNLPGSVGGVRDGLDVLADVVDHAVSQLRGGDH